MRILYMTIGLDTKEKHEYINKYFDKKTIVSPNEIRKELYEGKTDKYTEPAVWMTVVKRIQESLDKYGEAVLNSHNTNSASRRGFMTPFKKSGNVEFIALIFKNKPASNSKILSSNDTSNKDSIPESVQKSQYKEFIKGYSSIQYQFDKMKVVELNELQLTHLIKEIKIVI